MKKQIFILVFVLFSLGMTKSYGQLVPRPITGLSSDALHPVAGIAYNYTITVPTPAGTRAYTWFVTQEQQFINSGILTPIREAVGTGPLIYSAGIGYNNSGTATSNLSITWKSFTYDPTAPVFVVIQVTNSASTPDACATQNMMVYKIIPQNAFTLDIANLDAGASPNIAGNSSAGTYGANIAKCIHDIVGAKYDATAQEGVIYDYGIDYMFFEVVAANFNKSWKPSFTLTGIDANETVTIDWATTKNFASPHPLTLTGTIWASVDVYTTPQVSELVGSAGESIYVRVTLDHSTTTKTYQGLSDEVIILAVDGLTNLDVVAPALKTGDVHNSATLPLPSDLGKEDGYKYDIASQTLKPRPQIDAAATMPTPGLLPVKL